MFNGISFQYFQVLYIFFSPSIQILSWFGSSILSFMCHLPLILISMVDFSMPNSILMSWLHIPTTCIRVSNPFFFLANNLMSSIYIRWLIFSYNLLSLYTPMYFWVCYWGASSVLKIVMVIVHLPGIYLSGSLLQLSFTLLQSMPLYYYYYCCNCCSCHHWRIYIYIYIYVCVCVYI